LRIRMIAEMVNMDKEAVRQILHDRKPHSGTKRQLEKHLL
jgi:hypothetical protein